MTVLQHRCVEMSVTAVAPGCVIRWQRFGSMPGAPLPP